MEKYDIVIIGGSAAGIAALIGCARLYPNKSKLLIKKTEKTPIPCSIPYVYGELESCNNNLIPNQLLDKFGAKTIYDEVIFIDKKKKQLKLENGTFVEYDKLILGTGSNPIIPPISGVDKSGVFFVKKDVNYVDKLANSIKESQKIIIVGGGYIGVEFAEQIKEQSSEKEVSIIEGLDRCLAATFDEEFTNEVEGKLSYVGINLRKNIFVSEILGDTKVSGVKLSNGDIIDADLVIIGVGAKANSNLAKNSGLKISNHGDIIVDSFMKTSDKNIFAAGDCSESKSFFTQNTSPIKLSSVAVMEGRYVAENLYSSRFSCPGVIGAYATKIHDKAYAGVGYTQVQAKNEGFNVVIGNSIVMNRHPGSLNGSSQIKIKLIFNNSNRELLGAQISGPLEIAEIVNQLSIAIENKMTAHQLYFLQPATQPKLTASPLMYHIIQAANDALSKF